MNLLTRDWWKKLTFQQIQQVLIESSNQWEILSTGEFWKSPSKNICLFGLVANPILSVGKDQVQQLIADFEIICGSDRTGKTTGLIKIDLFANVSSKNLLFETLVALSRSNNPYIWIKDTVINYPEITIRVYKWGQKYEDLKIS